MTDGAKRPHSKTALEKRPGRPKELPSPGIIDDPHPCEMRAHQRYVLR
jgi:hypothetical protein